jgi:hypothetical protein
MPKLYISNATQQTQQFTFWMPEASRAMMQEIPIGGQIMLLSRDLSSSAIDSILEQHAKYGLVELQRALSSRLAVFHGLAYQLDKPVPFDKLLLLVDKYNSVLNQRGKQLRTEAAIATNEFIEDQMFQRQLPGRLDALEMSVEEVSRDGRDDSPEVSEGVRVIRNPGNGGRNPPRPRGNNRRQSARS